VPLGALAGRAETDEQEQNLSSDFPLPQITSRIVHPNASAESTQTLNWLQIGEVALLLC
jgi:hypothetical protein